MDESVDYEVDLHHRHAHLYAVEARFPVGGQELDLRLPVWTPGSYLIREFERHLQEITCDDGEGHPLPVKKIDKATWRVDATSAKRVRVRYRVYAFELTVRSAHLDDTHGFWNGACLFLYVDSLRQRRTRVRVVPPTGWRVTVALPEESPHVFMADNYDQLVDSPFEVGTHELVEFTAEGRPHRIAIWGRVEAERTELTRDFGKIIAAACGVFADEPPYPDYTFLLLSSPRQYGGLEHARSATLLTTPFSFRPRKKYEEFLELVAHEFFHLWNVKRIHPAALGPFDYQREAYTRALWMMEGVTSYYDRYLLVRAGLQSPQRYLSKLGEELGKIAATPGERQQSLEEASFDAWIKFYRPDENSVNSTVSYYLKGGVVALLCDLEIRARTENRRSLDDVMRLFWSRYGKVGVGFADEAVESLFAEASGLDLSAFFARHVRGREGVDAESLLRTVGLTVKRPDDDEEHPPVWLGVHIKEDGDQAVVAAAVAAEGSPALADGLYAHDEIVALDGFRVEAAQLKERLAVRRPGDQVLLTVFRRDELRTIPVTLRERPADKLEVVPRPDATATERAAYQAWLGHSF